MALYTLAFTVSAEGTTPAEPQPAGVFGDHQAALLSFTVPPEVPSECRFRLEIIDGSGGYDITELLEAENGVVSYAVPRAWTAAGTAAVRLIAVSENDSGEEVLCFHGAPAYLFFEEREDGSPLEATAGPVWQEVMHRAETVTNTLNHAMETGAFNGEKGEKGDKGDKGDMPEVDLAYDSTSANPQSGIALGPVISDISSAITHITGEIADARVDNFGNTHSSLGDSVRFMCHDLDSRKSNTDHEHRAEHIAIPAGIPHEQANENVYGALWCLNTEKSNKQEVANALKGTASGSVLALNDVSPVAHTMGVKVRGKNLFDYSGVKFNKSATNSTYVKENNGFTLTAGSSTAYFHTKNVSAFHLKPNTTYTSKATVTLTDNGSSNINEAASMRLSLLLQTNSTFDSSGKGKIYIVNGSAKGVGTHEIITTFTTPADMTDFQYVVTRLSNNTTVIFKDIQIECGSTATDYTPYISDYTAVPEKQWQQVFSRYCEYTNSGNEFFYAPIYTTKTFDIVVGREYTLETSNGMQGPNGLKYTCTAVENSYGGYSINCGDIRVETCSEDYAQQMIADGFLEYSEWIDKFRIAWVPATELLVDFTLTIKEHAGDMTKAVKLIKTNADGTVSEEYTPTADGTVNGVTSLYPCTKLSTDVDGIVIECEYNRDINKAFEELQQAIISLGGTV